MPVLLNPSLDVAEPKTPVLAESETGDAISRTASSALINPRIRNTKNFGNLSHGE